MESEQRWKAVKAHVAKGDKAKDKAEQHYIAAGQHLAALKAQHDEEGGTWAQWEVKVKEKAGIGKSRASELMQIASGTKTVEQVRTEKAKSVRQLRARTSPLRSGENADEPGQSHAKARQLSSPLISGGNAPDPEVGAADMKKKFAALEAVEAAGGASESQEVAHKLDAQGAAAAAETRSAAEVAEEKAQRRAVRNLAHAAAVRAERDRREVALAGIASLFASLFADSSHRTRLRELKAASDRDDTAAAMRAIQDLRDELSDTARLAYLEWLETLIFDSNLHPGLDLLYEVVERICEVRQELYDEGGAGDETAAAA
jgi:hypothetical protein